MFEGSTVCDVTKQNDLTKMRWFKTCHDNVDRQNDFDQHNDHHDFDPAYGDLTSKHVVLTWI